MAGDARTMSLTVARGDTAGDRAFRVTAVLLFATSALTTVWWCGSMSDGMPMPGGWTMSMAWMRMPGQTWSSATATFMGMWIAMMIAMMMPSLVPMLTRYRHMVRVAEERRLAGLTAVAAAGYFCAWTVLGAAAYPVGVVLAAAAMRFPALARLVPGATGVVLLLAGCMQVTAWKARALAHCREAPSCGRMPSSSARSAWSHGIDLGVHCIRCCAGLMAAMLVIDPMSVPAMTMVAAAVTAERLAPKPALVARATGVLLVATGALAIARALVG